MTLRSGSAIIKYITKVDLPHEVTTLDFDVTKKQSPAKK
jgi:hypothetical protein